MLGNDLPGALLTEFSLGPVRASVWCVGSAPGDSKSGGRVKDAAPGSFVRAEAQGQSEEKQQVLLCKGFKGASQCSPHTVLAQFGGIYMKKEE